MCGRYTLAKPEKIVVTFQPEIVDADIRHPRYNIAPMQAVPALGVHEGKRILMNCQWGLVPFWADDPSIGNRMINARAEGVASKPSFKASFRHHRCLLPADGFYEWQKGASAKQPFYIQPSSEDYFAFAGLYSIWTGRSGENYLVSCAIITTSANSLMREIHDRMPVILPRNLWQDWISPTVDDVKRLQELLVPLDSSLMTMRPVSKYVNSPANNTPECIA